VGTPVRQLLELAGAKGGERDYALISGGPCMGNIEEDWDTPVTKITGGLILLPREHALIAKRTMPLTRQIKLIQAVCCQCSQCTQLCPRNALGLDTAPHKAMRAMANADARLIGNPNSILSCCSCGLCTDYACHMGLTPSAVMDKLKGELAKSGVSPKPEEKIRTDEYISLKRVPTKRLIARMGLTPYDVEAPLSTEIVKPGKVRIPLRMHVGKPALPIVKPGDIVKAGERIAEISEKDLGVDIHASINGRVEKVTDDMIEIVGEG
jgi:Na+-translocating ferredoxin:NAD+ oxidoreductase RnfC subunit